MTDPGRAGCPELQGEELVGLQILMVGGSKHWEAVVGQGLSGWACPLLTSQAHEVTQLSALGEATGSKPVTQALRSSLPGPWGAGSQRSCYSQRCFPSAWHPQVPQPGLPCLPWQEIPHQTSTPAAPSPGNKQSLSPLVLWDRAAPKSATTASSKAQPPKKAVTHSPD